MGFKVGPARRDGGDAEPPQRIIGWTIVGAVVTVAGLALLAQVGLAAYHGENVPFPLLFWGVMTVAAGRLLAQSAYSRGWRSRFALFLVIAAGYVFFVGGLGWIATTQFAAERTSPHPGDANFRSYHEQRDDETSNRMGVIIVTTMVLMGAAAVLNRNEE